MKTREPWTQPDWVKLNLAASNAHEAIHELNAGLRGTSAVIDADRLLRDLLARQAAAPACLSAIIALPHARTPAVSRIVSAIGRSEAGVRFSATHPSIRLVILLGVPDKAVGEYLRWLARLAQALRNPAACEELLSAPTPEAFSDGWARWLGVSA